MRPTRRTAGCIFGLSLVLTTGCDDGASDGKTESSAQAPEMVEHVDGTITVGGKPAKVTSCKAVKGSKATALELTLETGLTIISDPVEGTQWRKDGAASPLDCERASSQMSAGSAGALAWATGELGLTCKHPDGDIEGDVKVDCGSKDRPSNAKPK